MSFENKCPICQREAAVVSRGADFNYDRQLIVCKRCGNYKIHDIFPTLKLTPTQKALLSGYTREKYNIGEMAYLTEENYLSILEGDPLIPKNVLDKTVKLLNYLNTNSLKFNQAIEFDINTDFSITYSEDYSETNAMLLELEKQGLVKYVAPRLNEIGVGISKACLTLSGVRYVVDSNRDRRTSSRQIFIALAFQSEIKTMIDGGSFLKLIKDRTGYEIRCIDKKEHVNKICDEIIAEINASKAIVVDVTDGNQGAYFEAGYAKGIGIPVIYVCKDAIKDGTSKHFIELVHFDIRQYRHILWKEEVDLVKKLSDTINAILVPV